MTPAELENLVAGMAGRRVLCVGDLVLDRFVYGRADRVSREAPVVALAEQRRETMLGACGNVGRNVAALGGAVRLVAVVGDDAEAHEVSSLVEAERAFDAELITARGRCTPLKTRYVANGQQILCVDRDPNGPISSEAAARFLDAAQAAVEDCDVVLLSDYARGALTPEVIAGVIGAANERGVKVIADPRGRDFSRYDGAYILKPNNQELATEAGFDFSDDDGAAAALAAVMARLKGVDTLIVTRSSRGMAALRRGALKPEFFRSQPRDVYDVSGAGDTSLAALGLATAAGAGLEQAIALANQAAGIVVTKVGTATVRADELIADARSKSIVGAPIAGDRRDAKERVARWKADGLRVGFTNGCFDVLHVGHLATLARARALCDRLVVGLNADASVSRLKGLGRPINPLDDRLRLIAALGPVDLVLGFEEDTAIAVIEALQPDVYIKGGDYDVDTLPEAPAVRAYGGEIALATFVDGRSTTATLDKLARTNGGGD